MAGAGRQVLVVSTDPAHSLGDALRRQIGPRATRVLTRRGALYAAELNADRALGRWMAERRAGLRTIAERGTFLDAEDIERFLALSFPGTDELVGLVELARLARAGAYDEVIVDTAPTGHTLRLLAMPDTLRRIAALLDQLNAKHRLLAERLGGRYRPDASEALIEEIAAQGETLHAMLRDPRRCSFSWVLLPEILSVEEARDGIRELQTSGIAVGEVIVNRLTPPPDGPCGLCEGKVRSERQALTALRRSFPHRSWRSLPALPREPRGGAALRGIGQRLMHPAHQEDAPRAGEARRVSRERPGPERRTAGIDWLKVLAPPGVRLLVFAGKGGVGKTTCAATAALRLAEAVPRGKVLLLSTDPAHSVADVLGGPVGDKERAVPGAPPALRGRELDAGRAFRAARARYQAAVEDLFDTLGAERGFDASLDRAALHALIDLAPPGLDELFAMFAVTEALVQRGNTAPAAEMVVLDTAPTGHALRLLALPGVALEWVGTLLSILLKYRKVTGLGQLAEDLLGMSRSLRQLSRLLRDPRAARVVVVARPAALPRLETIRLLDRLRDLRIAVSGVLVNALTPPGCSRCRAAAAIERRELERLGRDCVARRRGGRELVLAPAVAPPPRGIAALTRWGRTWTRAAA